MTDFTMSTDADGVATIVWDTIDKSMNVMNQQGFLDLDALVDQALADDAIKGVIITSGKEGTFAGGMDLNIIAKMKESAGDDPARGLIPIASPYSLDPIKMPAAPSTIPDELPAWWIWLIFCRCGYFISATLSKPGMTSPMA